MRCRPVVLLLVVGLWLVLAMGGCGGSKVGYSQVLTGTSTVQELQVGAGETVAISGAVKIACQSADIQGTVVPTTPGASLTIEAQQAIRVTGRIRCGDGQAGAARQAAGATVGGSLALTSLHGAITIGAPANRAARQAAGAALHAGDGGNGAAGQPGGTGGSVTLSCPEGTLTLHGQANLIHLGNGGHGGDTTTTSAGRQATAPLAAPANSGGDSGTLTLDAAQVAGVTPHTVAIEGVGSKTGIVFAAGWVTGGAGGNAGSYTYSGSPPAVRRTAGGRASREVFNSQGAKGGDGIQRGGNGGRCNVAIIDPQPNNVLPPHQVVTRGGDGGQARCYENRFSKTLLWACSGEVFGGHGGEANATGQPGAAGAAGSDAGDGGPATAVGGRGGDTLVLDRFLDYGIFVQHAGDGGDAYATGGDGGSSEDLPCPMPEPGRDGGDGGKGGRADATGGRGGQPAIEMGSLRARATGSREEDLGFGDGGDATARGGRGGEGGNGMVGGQAGAGGDALAVPGVGTPEGQSVKARGADGTNGTPCDKPPIGNNPPVAKGAVTPTSGDIDTTYTFSAAGSTDPDGPVSSLQHRWDFEGDGYWDTVFKPLAEAVTHKYGYATTPSQSAKVEVRDGGGKTTTSNIAVAVKVVLDLVSPDTLSVRQRTNLAGRVRGSNQTGVTYTVLTPNGGTVNDGIYTAPGAPGIYRVRGAAQADPSVTKEINVYVVAASANVHVGR